MRLESREFVLIAFCLGILLLFGLIGLQAQTVDDPILLEGLAALEAGDLDTAEARFQTILGAPASHTEEVVDLAQLGMLRVHRERDDLIAFETELQALEARSPTSPVIDDAIFLYAQFTFDRGEYHFSASIAELFLEDPVLTASEYGEEAAILAMEAYWKGYDAEEFERMRQVFLSTYPDSTRQVGVEFIRAQVVIDVERQLGVGVGLLDQILSDHPESSLVPEVRLRRATALWNAPRRWGDLPLELEQLATDFSESDPEVAADALVELAMARWIFDEDAEEARRLFTQVATDFSDTPAASEASQWAHAIEEPSSVDNVRFQWELFHRSMDIGPTFLHAAFSGRRLVVAAQGDPFQAFLDDPAVSDDEKAEMLYRVASANYNVAGEPAAWGGAQRIMQNYPETHAARVKAPFIRAMLLMRADRFEDARQTFRSIIENLTPSDEYAGPVYHRIAFCSVNLGDYAAAAEALATQIELFPDSEVTRENGRWLEDLIRMEPSLGESVSALRTDLQSDNALALHRDSTRGRLREALLSALSDGGITDGVASADAPPDGSQGEVEEISATEQPEPIAEGPPDGPTAYPGGAEVVR